MSKTKTWLVIAASLILIGLIIFWSVMTVLKWDFTKLSTYKYQTRQYEISNDFTDISIVTKTADITFAVALDGKCRVECYERENQPHSVTVKDNTLVIETGAKKWYEQLAINFGAPQITVYMPKGDYDTLSIKGSIGDIDIPNDFTFRSSDITLSTGDVKYCANTLGKVEIKATTGGITCENIDAASISLAVTTGEIFAEAVNCDGDFKLKVTTGDIDLVNVTCKNIASEGSTGDLNLENVMASEKISFKRSTGDIKFKRCDATEIFGTTDTGDIKGSLITEKVFIAHSDTGKVKVPKTVNGGKCELSTDTGNIKIEIAK